MGEMSVPVCSPKMLENHPIEKVSDIATLPLLHLASRPDAWESWFRAIDSTVTVEHGLVFEQFSTISQASVAGLGAGLLPKFLIGRELANRELEIIVDEPSQSDYGYYLISPNNQYDYEPVVAFRNWILSLTESYQLEASS